MAILFFFIIPKNTILEDDFEISLLVKFRLILVSRYREEVENISANQKPGRPSWFSNKSKKDVEALLPGSWHLIPSLFWACLWSNCWDQFSRTSRVFSPLFTYNIPRYFLNFAFCQVSLNSFNWLWRKKIENISNNQTPGWPSLFSDQIEKHKLGRGRWYLVFRLIPFWQLLQRKKIENASANLRPGSNLGKNTNL